MDIFKNEEDFYTFLESDKNKIEAILNNADHYYLSFVKEINGKKRSFHTANKELGKIQLSILRKILEQISLPNSMIGGLKKGSPKINAELHINKDLILTLDIKDFFPSIKTSRVFKLFSSLGFADKICDLLVRLTTRWGSLPPGVCTSTYIALLILRPMEKRFKNLCVGQGFTYSFYIDDITFSGRKKIKNFINLLSKIIEDEGFKINEKKKKVMGWNDRQEINKLVINSGVPNVLKEKRKIIRAKIHNFDKYNNDLSTDQKKSLLLKLYGEINYIKSVNKTIGEKLLNEYNKNIFK
ncbi:MAG: reverse transcriptase family protein [Candidatus Humimicrobiaceae bacterium]